MSGIVGGAGSKSGVIGETEIDYEEGEFSAVNSASTVTGKYRKIGKLCHVSMWFTSFTSSTPSPNVGYPVTGLPFTSDIGSTAVPTYNTHNADTQWIRLYDADTRINWQESAVTTVVVGFSFSYPTT